MSTKLSKDRLRKLFNEIKISEKYNDEELKPIITENIRRYTNQYKPDIGTNWQVIVNEFYPIVQSNLPSTFLNTPKIFLKPKNKFYIANMRNPLTGKKEPTQLDSTKSAATQEAIVNYRLTEIGYKQEVSKTVMDALVLTHGILWHGYKGNFGMTGEDEIFIRDESTFAKHVFPLDFIKDPQVSFDEVETGMWQGRIIDIPYDDLVEDKELTIEKGKIKGFKGYGTKFGDKGKDNGGQDRATPSRQPRTMLDCTDKDFQNSTQCRYIHCYEIFLRPTRKERKEGKPGKILLLTDEQDSPLRENDWTIKAEGFPGKVLLYNPVPGCHLPMSDIDTYKSSVDQKNAIYNLQLRNATENSKVWVAIATDGMDGEEDIEKIQQGDQTILLFKSDTVNGKMNVMSPSGMASSELYLIDGRIQRNIENLSGVSDLKKGFLQSGEESATSVKIRNAGSSTRPAYRQDRTSDFLIGSTKYILQLEKQFTTVKDAVRIVGSLDIQWSEKPSKEEIQADVDVDIDVVSMLPEDPERELRNLQTTLMLFINAIQSPQIMAKIQQEGKTINLSPLMDQILTRMRLKDPDIFRSIKPEEKMGFASIQQLQEAQQNVMSVIYKGQIATPPKEEDDHRIKLQIYTMVSELLKGLKQDSQALQQLIIMQQSMMEQMQAKEGQAEKPIQLDQNVRNL